MLKRFYNTLVAQKAAQRDAELYRKLIRHEAKIGGQLFGPVPQGGRREFFCLDEHTWVWHEEWYDHNRQHQIKTTRYDVRPDGIIKSQNGQYQQVSPQEARHLRDAVLQYRKRVETELYSFVV